MDPGGALLDEQLGQLHDSRQAAVAGVGVGDDGPQVVNVGQARSLGLGCREALLPLLAVVEQLGHEQMPDLVWDGGVRVVGKVRPRLVGRGGRRGGLPPGYVDCVEVFGHLSDHGGLEAAVRVAGITVLWGT
jgi:hypothetical protein